MKQVVNCIVGDFNIDLLKVGKDKHTEYLDLFQTNSFSPKLNLPTRFSSKSCTLLDNKKVYLQLHRVGFTYTVHTSI